jgi:hypothetical protein
MAKKTVKYIGLSLITVMFLGIVAFVCPVKAINVNVNQDTFVLSNEAPGYAISALVNAGYGDENLYQTLVDISASTNPSISGVLTTPFLQTLASAPASAQIFTTKLKDVNSQGVTIGISTDGTFLTNGVIVGYGANFTTLAHSDISGSSYHGKQGVTSLDTAVSSAGSFRLVYNSSGPITSWTVNGPLAGMTTTYNIFGILYDPISSASPSPSPTSQSTSQPTPAPSVPEFSTLTILLAVTVVSIALLTLLKSKRKLEFRSDLHL